jgi:hypothetical protein
MIYFKCARFDLSAFLVRQATMTMFKQRDVMHEERLAQLLNRFAAAAKAHHAALVAMDDVRANAHARIIAGLYESLVREGRSGREGLLALIESNDDVVAGMAAVYSIRYDPDRCVALLRKLAKEKGLLGFRASVALQRWEAGEWGGEVMGKVQ